MQKKDPNSVFDLLAKPVQKALSEAGFTEPTLPQTMAFPSILAGKNVLLIAPTGTGKTEVALRPVFSRLVDQKNDEQKGIQVIYITPLRALNRDVFKCLTFWSQRLGISVEVRHGDT
jgi:ATP-dependent Lhr-like helicase